MGPAALRSFNTNTGRLGEKENQGRKGEGGKEEITNNRNNTTMCKEYRKNRTNMTTMKGRCECRIEVWFGKRLPMGRRLLSNNEASHRPVHIPHVVNAVSLRRARARAAMPTAVHHSWAKTRMPDTQRRTQHSLAWVSDPRPA
jgi:hypothetical protein